MSFRHKIKSPAELVPILVQLKTEGKRIVLCHGVFDLYHRGHLHQFEQARAYGDILVVSLTTDRFVRKGPGRPIFDQITRAEMMAGLELVDYVILSDEESSVGIIHLVKPDVYVKGQQYAQTAKDLTGKISQEQEAVEAVGGKIHFTVEMPIRSTPLLNNYVDPYPEVVRNFLAEFKRQYPLDQMISWVESLANLNVLVLGEAIIDQYDLCQPLGFSPKGGVVALHHQGSEVFAGGSLACANHMASFCRSVCLITGLGSTDSYETFILQNLAPNVEPHFVELGDRQTIVKRRQFDRVYSAKKSETYHFNPRSITAVSEEMVLAALSKKIVNVDLMFVIDYGHGFITPAIIERLVQGAPFLAVNTQANSANHGRHVITRYPRADYICLDDYEVRLTVRDDESSIEEIGDNLARQLNCSAMAVTMGHRGSLISGLGERVQTPVFSKSIVDTVGAGDAFFSVTAPAVAKGLPLPVAGFLGNAVGALATTYIGNKKSVTKQMLYDFMRTLLA